MHHKLRVLIILLVLFSASYSYAGIKYKQKISAYDAAKSEILRNMAENSSYSILENRHYQTISRLSKDINRNRYYSPALGRFTTKDPIGFNGGMNLYRYADNNPMRWVDPFGLIADDCKEYKDLVVRVLNYYDKLPFHWNDYVLRTAFEFFKGIPNGPELKIFNHFSGGNSVPLGTIDRTSSSWTLLTDLVFNSYRREDNETEKIANIIISNTNWGSTKGATAGLTDAFGRNQALVSGNYYAHEDPIKLGWTVAHETGHILTLADNNKIILKDIMTQGAWSPTSFTTSQIETIKVLLKKNEN